MTNEVADWTGNGRRLRSRTSTVNDSTGSTIMIIIVGPIYYFAAQRNAPETPAILPAQSPA